MWRFLHISECPDMSVDERRENMLPFVVIQFLGRISPPGDVRPVRLSSLD